MAETGEVTKQRSGGGFAVKVGIIAALAVGIAATIYAKRQAEQSPTAPPSAATATARSAAEPATDVQDAAREDSVEEVAPAPSLPRLVDVGAEKCIPCVMMAPILKELKKEYAGRFEVEFVDVWKNPDAGAKYNLRVIPTQIFYDGTGKELYRHEGFFSKADILATWEKLGVPLKGNG